MCGCVFVCVFELECDCTEYIREAVEAVVCFKAPIKTQQTPVFYTKQLPSQTGQHFVRRFKRFSWNYRKSESTYVGD